MTLDSVIQVGHELVAQIIDSARHGYPYEICGLIGGHGKAAASVWPVLNVSPTPEIAYEMERQTMIETIIAIEKAGQEVVAIYHSHPKSEAIPSERDIAEATWPDAVYIIVGLGSQRPEVRGWIIRQRVAECGLEIK